MLVNPQQALPNQTITVHWDYESPDKLRTQWMEVISLTIEGQMLRQVEGRPMLSNGHVETEFESYPEMPQQVRDRSFIFKGPVTVVIGAQDTDGKILRAAVDVMLQDAFLRVSVKSVDHNLSFPRGILFGNKPETLEFPVFFATYDEPPSGVDSPNGFIDFFQRLGVQRGQHGEPFFARSNTADQNNHFGFAMGIDFPMLASDYLWYSPDAMDRSQNERFSNLKGQYLYSDAILFGGKIAYSGQVLVTKGPTGEVVSRTGNLSMEPIFFQIDFRSEKEGALHVVDMHLGNVPQGFVASAYWGLTSGRSLNAPILPVTSYYFSQASVSHPTGIFSATLALGTTRLGFNVGAYSQYIDVTGAI